MSIGECVPARVVWIVARTNCIDVVQLHQFDIAAHSVHTDNVTGKRVRLVPIDAADGNWLPVDAKLVCMNIDGSKSDFGPCYVACRIGFILQSNQ